MPETWKIIGSAKPVAQREYKMKGILFKPDMIKAIINGSKVMTRRVIKFSQLPNIKNSDWHAPWFNENLGKWVFTARFGLATKGCWIKPHYHTGETVYIKEATCIECYGKDSIHDACYKTDEDNAESIEVDCDWARWRSPMFMFAWAARYFIQITDVRAERLKEISLSDIYAEGCPLEKASVFTDPENGYQLKSDAYEWYHDTWDSINGKGSWDKNEWVWKYSFVRLDKYTE